MFPLAMTSRCSGTIQILLETGHTELGGLFHQASPSQSPQGQQTHFPDTAQGPPIHKTIPDVTGYEAQHENSYKIFDQNKCLCKEHTNLGEILASSRTNVNHSTKCLSNLGQGCVRPTKIGYVDISGNGNQNLPNPQYSF
jgi:hypothetical protein